MSSVCSSANSSFIVNGGGLTSVVNNQLTGNSTFCGSTATSNGDYQSLMSDLNHKFDQVNISLNVKSKEFKPSSKKPQSLHGDFLSREKSDCSS